MEQILIIGSGGHAASLADIMERENKYKIAGYIVNECETRPCIDYPVIGTDEELEALYRSGIKYAAMGIGYLGKSDLRERLYRRLKKIGFYMPVICDPSAIVSEHVQMEEGTVVGKGVIINTGVIVEHECRIADFSHISVGSVLCGGVTVKKAAFIGANATVIQGRVIGSNCIVGAGTVIRKNVEEDKMICEKYVEFSRGGGYKLAPRKKGVA